MAHLSPRQRQVVELICRERLSVVDVARRLQMPIATARAHVRAIGRRLANPHGLPAYRLIQSYAPLFLVPPGGRRDRRPDDLA